MPTIGPISIAANGDDGQGSFAPAGWNASGESASGYIYPGYYDSAAYPGVWRFILPSAIPAGATITSAIWEGFHTEYWNWETSQDFLELKVELSADAAAITSGTDLNSRSLSSSVRWPASGGLDLGAIGSYKSSPNIASLIQSLVDTYGGLASGAAIQIVIACWTDIGNAEVGFYDYAGNSSNVAKLTIDYTPGGVPPHARPYSPDAAGMRTVLRM